MVFATPEGAKTMSQKSQSPAVTPFAKTLADEMIRQVQMNVRHIERDKETRLLAAHQEAENALSMALHYLRKGSGNVPGAMRKAVQALAALNTLQGAGAGRKIGGAA
jgi:hypothetical protein